MKKSLLILFLLVQNFFGFSQWQQVPGLEGGQINALVEVGQELWVATESGLYISIDQGNNWDRHTLLPRSSSVIDLAVFGDEILMLVFEMNVTFDGQTAKLYSSNNSGNSWTINEFPFNVSANSYNSLFKIADTIFFRRNSKCYKSIDWGNTWTEIELPNNSTSIKSFTSDDKNLLLATYTNEIFISFDKGINWEPIYTIQAQGSILLEDSLIIIPVINSRLHKSKNRGIDWEIVPFVDGFYSSIKSFHRGKSGRLYAISNRIAYSDDDASSWIPLDTTFTGSTRVILEQGNGEYFIGSNLGFHKTINNGTNWSLSNSGIIALDHINAFAIDNGDIFTHTNIGDFRSSNEGDTWNEIEVPFNLYFKEVFQVGDSIFLLADDYLFLSTDSLYSFTQISPSGSFFDFTNIQFYNNRIYIAGNNILYIYDLKYHTITPISLDISSDFEASDLKIIKNGAIFLLIGKNGKLYTSSDQGSIWSPSISINSSNISDDPKIYQFGSRLIISDKERWMYSSVESLDWDEFFPSGCPLRPAPWNDPIYPNNIVAIDSMLFGTIQYHGIYSSRDFGFSWQPFNAGLEPMYMKKLYNLNNQLYTLPQNNGIWKFDINQSFVEGLIYEDSNNDGNWNPGEKPLPNIVIQSRPLNFFSSSFQNGSYTLFTLSTNDTIYAISPSPYSIVNPPYHLINQSTSDKNFGIYFIPGKKDLCISLTNMQVFRPGFDNEIVLTLKNVGTSPLVPKARLTLPSELTYLSAIPTPTQITGQTINWQLTDTLYPLEDRNIYVRVNLLANTGLGNALTIEGSVLPFSDDLNVKNNTDQLTSIVVGSYDPNDKQVQPEDIYTPTQLNNEEKLTYTIRFQNTGTFYAENVLILDTISRQLNLSSLEVIAASHSLEWNIRGGNVLAFEFAGIFLPDSTTNEPESHGFVKFSMLPVRNLNLGTTIENRAFIYFDFNDPIETNTISNTYQLETSTKKIANQQPAIHIQPNPAADFIELIVEQPIPDTFAEVKLYNAQGKLLQCIALNKDQRSKRIETDQLPSGVYWLRYGSRERFSTTAFVIQR